MLSCDCSPNEKEPVLGLPLESIPIIDRITLYAALILNSGYLISVLLPESFCALLRIAPSAPAFTAGLSRVPSTSGSAFQPFRQLHSVD